MSIWANAPAAPTLPSYAEVVVVGGGPAGYTAALYLARACREPLVLAGTAAGGQLMDTGIVENFPGFPDGIDGPELMTRMREQAEKAGATVLTVDADAIDYGPSGRERSEPGRAEHPDSAAEPHDAFPVHEVRTAEGTVRARAVVLATGSAPNKLGIEGESTTDGVAYCAVCEAPLHKGNDVVVVGGGDSAMEEVLAVSKHARRVHLVHRRDTFRAAPVMVERVRGLANVEVTTGANVSEIRSEAGRLTGVRLDTGAELDAQGLFVAIGHTARAELLPEGGTDAVDRVPGLFVAGDLADDVFRQAVTAAGSGCAAALTADRYLEGI